jgi:hypothetical protein
MFGLADKIRGYLLYQLRAVLGCTLTSLIAMQFAACSTPAAIFNKAAKASNYRISEHKGLSYKHIVFENSDRVNWAEQDTLHIYIEGDGTPWIGGRWVATDPTPRDSVMLPLMDIDNNAAMLLGRPCYHRQSPDPSCHPRDWTIGRYSPRIVNSMANVIRGYQERQGFKQVVLFGHSGGGTLATLVAYKLDHVKALVTIAPNLDVDRWTQAHKFLPLAASSNPAKFPPLENTRTQLHLFGANDATVEAEWFNDYFRQMPRAKRRIFEDFDHSCCWAIIWPSILSQLP